MFNFGSNFSFYPVPLVVWLTVITSLQEITQATEDLQFLKNETDSIILTPNNETESVTETVFISSESLENEGHAFTTERNDLMSTESVDSNNNSTDYSMVDFFSNSNGSFTNETDSQEVSNAIDDDSILAIDGFNDSVTDNSEAPGTTNANDTHVSYSQNKYIEDSTQEIQSVNTEEVNETIVSNTSEICGRKLHHRHNRRKRVIGGGRIFPGDFPWLVSLYFEGNHPFQVKSGFKHLCGGTLIHPQWVLSAAHCFDAIAFNHLNDTNYWTVVAGEYDLRKNESYEQFRAVEKIIRHENSTIKPLKYDIALLKLQEPVVISKYVNTICLYKNESFIVGETCTITGWGTHSTYGKGSAIPYQTSLDIIYDAVCEARVFTLPDEGRNSYTFYDGAFCASGYSKDACYGDSGGPLQCYRNGKWHIIGIISYGYKCGEYPGAYANVNYFYDWIQDKINNQ
ncbi:tryptase beta-2-like [Octopus sinensis]|uniref:Tryptase beta-2-like n=1 Tax=Octopus sinensis TaxID=2607531 RepID=A0A7E6ERI0_9MOLL|nr:tryptase beta-2-like [Octopus sinensis]